MSQKILVTGATGTIGSFVIEQLRSKGADFVALVRNENKAEALESKGVKTVIADFGDRQSMVDAMNGIDKLFLLSVTSPEIPKLQANATDAAKGNGVRHIVKISARGAAPDSDIGITRFHARAEAYIRDSGIPFTFIRPESFMQNLIFDRETIRDQGSIYAQTGDGKIAMVDARDIAAAASIALLNDGHEGKTYELTGPEAVSYHDIASTFSKVLGRTVRYIPVTSVQARSSMLEAGMPAWLVEDLVAVGKLHASGLAGELSPDLERVTGSKGHSVEDFIRDYIHLFK